MAIHAGRRKPSAISGTLAAFVYRQGEETCDEQQSVRIGDGGFGLSGAMGVFGAVARTSLPVVLVPK
jgi:hypothetical protein